MADQEARELRRQKILKNSQNRLDLLLGKFIGVHSNKVECG
jgi:hypothetical protein